MMGHVVLLRDLRWPGVLSCTPSGTVPHPDWRYKSTLEFRIRHKTNESHSQPPGHW